MSVNVTITGLAELKAELKDFSERRINAAVATALTKTAQLVRDKMKEELPRVFDRPTAYTMNSLFIQTARADRLNAAVKFKDDLAGSGTPATKYLLPNVDGGQRRAKRFEVVLQAVGALPSGWFVTPGPGANLDAFGNVSRGQIIQVLSQLRITLVAGTTRNMSFDARKQIAAQRKAGGRFFVVKPGGKMRPGVYQREFIGRNVTPVFWFVPRANYGKRFDFYGKGRAWAEEILPAQLRLSVQDQVQRLAAKQAGGGS